MKNLKSEINKDGDLYKSVHAASENVIDILFDYISEGYLKTIAHILCYMGKDSERAVNALTGFTPSQQEKIKSLINEMSETEPQQEEIMVDAANVLNQSDFCEIKQIKNIISDEDSLCNPEIFPIIDDLMKTNPLLALALNEYAVCFDDLKLLGDRDIQRVLRDVDTVVLARALKTADEAVCDKIFRNMSRRAADMLREDMEFMGPIRLKDSIEAQKQIAKIIMRNGINNNLLLPGIGNALID